ncbi:8561_t:CDS:2 [Paraglomus brasilianum]|uniref:8561_t:CDS:1 n=1 Tax=Paraglomus brasilianum TaxID=144538 RepID=A0A9N9GH28_9GLOM|nr:8561_t:CDS:2 [Paraglomus brasilianum]
MAKCIFCKIIKREMPSYKLLETEHSYAFLDIFPLSKGHSLVIPKSHAEFFHELSDESVADLSQVTKKVANAVIAATGETQYNILQNNGARAHQVVKHVHFHIIPKPEADSQQGLMIEWPSAKATEDELKDLSAKVLEKL